MDWKKIGENVVKVIIIILRISPIVIAVVLAIVAGVLYGDLQNEKIKYTDKEDLCNVEKSQLNSQIETLNAEKSSLETQVSTLTTEKTNLENDKNLLTTDVAKYQKIFYHRGGNNDYRYVIAPIGKTNSLLRISNNTLTHNTVGYATPFSIYRNVNNNRNNTDFPKSTEPLFMYTNINSSVSPITLLKHDSNSGSIKDKTETEYETDKTANGTALTEYKFYIKAYKRHSNVAGTYNLSQFVVEDALPINTNELYFIFVDSGSTKRIMYIDTTVDSANVLSETYNPDLQITIDSDNASPNEIHKYLFKFNYNFDPRYDGLSATYLGDNISMPNLLPYYQTFT